MERLKIPFIKFPPDWEIKFIIPPLEGEVCPFRCFAKKDGAPNMVAFAIMNVADEFEWEIIAMADEYEYYYANAAMRNCAIENVDGLIKRIEELLYTEDLYDPQEDHSFDLYEE